MKALNLYTLLILTFFFSCQDKQKEEKKQIAQLVNEWQGKQSEVKETTIEIKNIGDNPLVIVDVSTTCGCTAATYDKRPAKPGETLRVGIKMTPKDTGFFDETVTIKYNSLNNQHVKLKIKGNVR